MDPIFPNLTTVKALEHLFEAANVDPGRILQQTVCYDRWFSWTISVSWGYAVQVFGRHMNLPDILPVKETFQQWKKRNTQPHYTFNTRELHPDPCQRPTIFFLDNVTSGRDGIRTSYRKSYVNCSRDMASPRKLDEIRVLSHKLELDLTKVFLILFFGTLYIQFFFNAQFVILKGTYCQFNVAFSYGLLEGTVVMFYHLPLAE